MPVSQRAVALIQFFEGCLSHPNWPGKDSGITIGWGCDIGAAPESLADWQNYLNADDYAALDAVDGLRGLAAKNALASVQNILIPQAAADAVFFNCTLPAQTAATAEAFPGANALADDSFGALVSLVYNRGPKLTGTNRGGMQAIHDDLAAGQSQWLDIVNQIAAMSTIWIPTSGPPTSSNLPGRRLAEAALFARGLRDGVNPSMLPGALLNGDSGSGVTQVQTALGIDADSQFGPHTMVAVWNYQESNGLTATGVADAATITQLTSA